MIDVIINEIGGLTVAHDERALDGYLAIEVGADDGAAVLTGPGGPRPIGTLAPAMRARVAAGMPGLMVRFSGWSLARISPLLVRTLR